VNRLSAIIDESGCRTDEIVPDQPVSERDYAANTALFAHVEWRSTAEVFQYLGALLRNRGEWNEDADATVAACAAFHTGVNSDDPCRDVAPNSAWTTHNKTFALAADSTDGRVVVNYRGRDYSVRSRFHEDPAADDSYDHSLETLSMLSELVNAAKVSSDIPVTPQLQLIP
jgi:hypothetical protein